MEESDAICANKLGPREDPFEEGRIDQKSD
jgi:hypothetical protein